MRVRFGIQNLLQDRSQSLGRLQGDLHPKWSRNCLDAHLADSAPPRNWGPGLRDRDLGTATCAVPAFQ